MHDALLMHVLQREDELRKVHAGSVFEQQAVFSERVEELPARAVV